METTTIKKQVSWWDWTGVFFSGLCVVHCIATPLLLAGASIWIASEWVHVGFLAALVPITIVASKRTCPSHRKSIVVTLFFAGLAFLGAAVFIGESLGESGEIILTIIGSIMLIAGHLQNRLLSLVNKK